MVGGAVAKAHKERISVREEDKGSEGAGSEFARSERAVDGKSYLTLRGVTVWCSCKGSSRPESLFYKSVEGKSTTHNQVCPKVFESYSLLRTEKHQLEPRRNRKALKKRVQQRQRRGQTADAKQQRLRVLS